MPVPMDAKGAYMFGYRSSKMDIRDQKETING